MSALGVILAPVVAAATAAGDGSQNITDTIDLPADSEIVDAFGELAPMDATAMSQASGGSGINIDVGIDDIAMNESSSGARVQEVTNQNTTNGQIANNAIDSNSGITTVFNNTGNGVVMQSTVNVNVFLD